MKKTDAIDEKDYLFNKMLDLLAKQNYTKKQIKDKLFNKTKDWKLVNDILEKLEAYGYIDDQKFADGFVKNYCASRSKRELQFKMMLKGVPEQCCKNALDGYVDEFEAGFKVAEKYMRNKEISNENVQKLYAYLFGKGFASDVISKIVRDFKLKIKEEFDD